MAEIQIQAVTLKHEKAGTNTGQLHRQLFNSRDRLRRSATAWLICWGLAVLSVPIIFAHWVLVPGFIIAGPFVAYRYYHIMAVPQKITGTCPSCQEALVLKLETSDKLPTWRYCSNCNESLHINESLISQA